MKYNDIAKAALVLVLGVMTSTAFAANLYEETFEGPAANSAITNLTGWTRSADDVSKIVVTNTYTGTKLLPDPHTKVLQLNTEGGVLTNDIADVSFSSATRYVDTLVKFVPSEDLPEFDAAGDIKVAVYAYVKEVQASPLITATNLAIYHGALDDELNFSVTNTVTDLTVDPNAWYRLTIELANRTEFPSKQGFRVFLNGVPLTDDAAYAEDTWSEVDLSEPPADGTWFLSAAAEGNVTVATIQFKGTGFIDDLAVTAEDPFAIAPPAGFIVTQNIGANGGCSDETSPMTVTGVSTTLTYTADDFYSIASLTTNGVAVAGAATSKFKTIDIYGATAVTSTFAIASSYTADAVAWFTGKWTEDEVIVGLDYAKLEMLNCAPTNATADGTITIEAIEVVGDDVKVTVFIDRTMSIGADIVGTLKLYGATTLEGGFTEIGAGVMIGTDQAPSQDDIRKEITYIMAGGKKFYKAVIE